MNRDLVIDALSKQGITFLRMPFLNGQPRQMGRDEADTIEADIVGTPGYMRSTTLAGAWNTAATKKHTLKVLRVLLASIFADQADQVVTDLEKQIPEAEKALNRAIMVADLNRCQFSIQVIRFPGARVLMSRLVWRLVDTPLPQVAAGKEQKQAAGKRNRKRHNPISPTAI